VCGGGGGGAGDNGVQHHQPTVQRRHVGVAVAWLAGRQPIFKGDFLGGRGGPLFYILFIWGVVVPVRVVQQQQQHNINPLIYNTNKTIVPINR
jgi:hypothetical protein